MFLLCPPTYFSVDYSINPWMDPVIWEADPSYHHIAVSQWAGLHGWLKNLNQKIMLVDPVKGFPDMVFTANAGFCLDNKVLLSNFKYPQRKGEAVIFKEFFQKHYHTVETLPDEIFFEGAGDCLYDEINKVLWVGHGFRSDRRAREYLEDVFGVESVGLRLVNPLYYHLDTCFCPLTNGEILYYPAAFDEASRDVISDRVPTYNLIGLTLEEAIQFSGNSVCIENNIIMSKCTKRLGRVLFDRGYKVIRTPLDAFQYSGGSAKCLTLKL